jgi:hypothetical protein
VEKEKERQREEDLRKRKEEEQDEKEAWAKVKEEKKISTYKPSFVNHADTYKDPEDLLALAPELKSPTDTKTIGAVKFTFPGGLITVGQTT